MKNIALFLCLLLLSPALFAQSKWLDEESQAEFNAGTLRSIDPESLQQNAEDFIFNKLPELKPNNSGLKLIFKNNSLVGNHLDFIQTFNNTEIYGSDIKINLSKRGEVLSFFHKTIATATWDKNIRIPDANRNAISQNLDGGIDFTYKQVIFIENDKPVPAYQIEYRYKNGRAYDQLVMDMNYHILYRKDKVLHYQNSDTLVKAYVFLPDPLTTAEKSYGSPYKDFNDSAVAELDAERKQVSMRVSYYHDSVSGNDSFYLESKYMRIEDLDLPHTQLTFARNPLFIYSRHQAGFEDVNSFYHINAFQAHIQKLGIHNLAQYQLIVDPHGTVDDNSQFVAGSNNYDMKLYYGTGGVDDAEDADVIVHEYNHYVSQTANGGTVEGSERAAMEEGLCDYFACSYSKMLNPYHWEQSFNWDGHNEFWKGRSCVTSLKYKSGLIGDTYHDAELWTGTLMDIEDSLGRDTTDFLMLNTEYSLSKGMKMSQAAKVFLQSDSLLFKGSHRLFLIKAFVNRELLSGPLYKGIADIATPVSAEIVSKYFSEDGFLYIKFNKPLSGRANLYDIQGKELLSTTFSNENVLNIYEPELAAGIYVLHITSNGIQQTIKLLKNGSKN